MNFFGKILATIGGLAVISTSIAFIAGLVQGAQESNENVINHDGAKNEI